MALTGGWPLDPRVTVSRDVGTGAAWLAALAFLYIWITLTPFRDLTQNNLALNADIQSNTLNQTVAIVIFALMMALGLRKELRPLLMGPLPLIACLLMWLAFVTVIGPAGAVGVRRLVMAAILMAMASVFLLLPRNEKQLAGILAGCAGVVLALCYFGVIFLPRLSIHQMDDFLEPALAGDWRGMFDHKNNAAPSMVVLAFIGLYVMQVRSRVAGLVIFALAAFFVFKSGGKTAMTLLPITLVLAWLIERGNMFWRSLIVLGVVAGYSALTVGSVLVPSLGGFVESLGIDASFTGRTDIWELAIGGIQARPLFGYGFGGFWGTEGLVFGFREEASWAVQAPTAHNSYVDMVLLGGFVGLALVVTWVVLLPLRDLSTAIARNGPTALTRLFTRIWIFSLVLAGMESMFMSTNGVAWFSLMIAVFGLRLEARAHRRAADPMASAGLAQASPYPA